MLVIFTDEQILDPHSVCQTCLLADQSGLPRWREGKLSCGQLLRHQAPEQSKIYRCHMGFRLANIEGSY